MKGALVLLTADGLALRTLELRRLARLTLVPAAFLDCPLTNCWLLHAFNMVDATPSTRNNDLTHTQERPQRPMDQAH